MGGDFNVDENEIEKLQSNIEKRTALEVKLLSGNHKLILGSGTIFRISPINNTYVIIAFRQTFFDLNDHQYSQLLDELSYKIKNIVFREPSVIEVDDKIHNERPHKSFRMSSK